MATVTPRWRTPSEVVAEDRADSIQLEREDRNITTRRCLVALRSVSFKFEIFLFFVLVEGFFTTCSFCAERFLEEIF